MAAEGPIEGSFEGSFASGFLAGLFAGCFGLALVGALAKGQRTKRGALAGFFAQLALGTAAHLLSG